MPKQPAKKGCSTLSRSTYWFLRKAMTAWAIVIRFVACSFIKHAAWRPVSVYGMGGNAALLSTNKAEAFWTTFNFLKLALALTLTPSRLRRSKKPELRLPNTQQNF